MSQNQNTWLDDPEWDELRQKTTKKRSFLRKKAISSKLPEVNAAPTPISSGGFLAQPSSADLRRVVSGQKTQNPVPPTTARPQFKSAPPSFGRTMPAQRSESVAAPVQPPKQSFTPPKPQMPAEPFFQTSKAAKRDKPVEAFDVPADKRPVQVSINLSLPSVDTLEPLIYRAKQLKKVAKLRPSAKQLKIVGVICGIAVLSVAGYNVVPGMLHKDQGSQVLADKVEKPTYAVTKPSSTEAEQVKFDSEKKVASYGDKVNGITVVVSQQPLPASFKEDPFGQLEKIATSFSATESFAVNDFKVFIGTSAKGPQSLLLIKDKKLIFLRSDSKIPNADWVTYIETMKTS